VPRRSSSHKAPLSGTALQVGLRLLARRDHSRRELERKLLRRGHDSDEVAAAMIRLKELGYMDDAAFASGLVRRRSSNRGPLALSAELAGKGIDRSLAEAALALFDPGAQLEAATRIAERLYAAGPRLGYREALDRIGSKLARRGYPAGIIRQACRTVLSQTVPDPEA